MINEKRPPVTSSLHVGDSTDRQKLADIDWVEWDAMTPREQEEAVIASSRDQVARCVEAGLSWGLHIENGGRSHA